MTRWPVTAPVTSRPDSWSSRPASQIAGDEDDALEDIEKTGRRGCGGRTAGRGDGNGCERATEAAAWSDQRRARTRGLGRRFELVEGDSTPRGERTSR